MAVVGGLRWLGALGGVKITNPNASDVGMIAGEKALDGSNPTPVVTPFKKVLAVWAAVKRTTAAAAGAAAVSNMTYDIAANVVNFYAWNDTATADANDIASTATTTFSYMIVGEM